MKANRAGFLRRRPWGRVERHISTVSVVRALSVLALGMMGLMTVLPARAEVPSCRTVLAQLVPHSGATGWVSTPGAHRAASWYVTVNPGALVLVPATQQSSRVICMASDSDKSEGLGYIWSSGLTSRDTDVDSVTTTGAVTSVKGYTFGESTIVEGLPWNRANLNAPSVQLVCTENATGRTASANYPGDTVMVPPMGGGMAFIRCPGSGKREVTMSVSASPFQGVTNSRTAGVAYNDLQQSCSLNSPNTGAWGTLSGGPLFCGGIVGVGDGSEGPAGLLYSLSTQNAGTLVRSLRNIGTGGTDSWQPTACTVSLSQASLDWGIVSEKTLTTGGAPAQAVTVTASCSGWQAGAPGQGRNWLYLDGPVVYRTTQGSPSYSGSFYASSNPSFGFALTKQGSSSIAPGSLPLPARLLLPWIQPDADHNTVQRLSLEFTPFLFQGESVYGSGQSALTIDVWTNLVESA